MRVRQTDEFEERDFENSKVHYSQALRLIIALNPVSTSANKLEQILIVIHN